MPSANRERIGGTVELANINLGLQRIVVPQVHEVFIPRGKMALALKTIEIMAPDLSFTQASGPEICTQIYYWPVVDLVTSP